MSMFNVLITLRVHTQILRQVSMDVTNPPKWKYSQWTIWSVQPAFNERHELKLSNRFEMTKLFEQTILLQKKLCNIFQALPRVSCNLAT